MVFLSPLEAAKLAGEVCSVNQEDKFALDGFWAVLFLPRDLQKR